MTGFFGKYYTALTPVTVLQLWIEWHGIKLFFVFFFISFWLYEKQFNAHTNSLQMQISNFPSMAGCLGFVYFNFHPAKAIYSKVPDNIFFCLFLVCISFYVCQRIVCVRTVHTSVYTHKAIRLAGCSLKCCWCCSLHPTKSAATFRLIDSHRSSNKDDID